ncbi:MAG TPA: exopolysaccharide biosynthesis protein [Thermoanaerobaculia bacterium]|nr:exopolysaccharide biosynthesis protein [Thermoanaerobaculia bacterium]
MTPTVDEDGESLAEKMQMAIDRLPPEGVTLVEIRDLIGREGMMLLTAFLTIVFLVPVSIPGVSTVFGGAILLLSFSRLLNRPLWLPDRLKRRPVSTVKLRAAMERGMRWFRRMERISRPRRMRALTTGRVMGVINNSALILGAVLLMAPFGLIPFSNTLPAVAILLFAIGMLQRDGGCILLGHLMNIATIVYFGVLIGGGAVVIQQAFEKIFR